MIKKLLKFVDRKILAVFVFMVVAFLGVHFFWVSAASSRLADARVERAATEKEFNELKSRLSDSRSDGVTSADALLSRVQRLEALLPFGLNDISMSQIVVANAESSGVVLERFQLAAEDRKKDEDKPEKDPNVLGGLKSYRYDFKVTGPYLAVVNFLDAAVSSNSIVITFDGLYFYSATNVDNPTIFDSSVTAEGTMLIWTSLEKHVSPSTEKPADSSADQPAVNPDQPADPADEPTGDQTIPADGSTQGEGPVTEDSGAPTPEPPVTTVPDPADG